MSRSLVQFPDAFETCPNDGSTPFNFPVVEPPGTVHGVVRLGHRRFLIAICSDHYHDGAGTAAASDDFGHGTDYIAPATHSLTTGPWLTGSKLW